MATKLGQKNPWCEFIMMMTFMEVKGHQRSNVVNYVLWLPNLVRRISDARLWWWWPSWRSKVIRGQMRKLCAMATKLSQKKSLVQVYDDDDDLHEGQRSSEVKCGKRCTLVTKLGQKESLMQVYDGDDLHEGQRSSEVKCGKLCTMVTKIGQQNR